MLSDMQPDLGIRDDRADDDALARLEGNLDALLREQIAGPRWLTFAMFACAGLLALGAALVECIA